MALKPGQIEFALLFVIVIVFATKKIYIAETYKSSHIIGDKGNTTSRKKSKISEN